MNKLLHTVPAGILTLSALTVPERSHARYPEGTTGPAADSLQIEQVARQYYASRSKSWDKYQARSARTTDPFLKKLQQQAAKITKEHPDIANRADLLHKIKDTGPTSAPPGS